MSRTSINRQCPYCGLRHAGPFANCGHRLDDELPATPDAGARAEDRERIADGRAENDACHYCQAPHPVPCRPGCAGGAE